jgi:hypothetical protein
MKTKWEQFTDAELRLMNQAIILYGTKTEWGTYRRANQLHQEILDVLMGRSERPEHATVPAGDEGGIDQ